MSKARIHANCSYVPITGQGEALMSILADLSVIPSGEADSLNQVISLVLKSVVGSGVSYKAHPVGKVRRSRRSN